MTKIKIGVDFSTPIFLYFPQKETESKIFLCSSPEIIDNFSIKIIPVYFSHCHCLHLCESLTHKVSWIFFKLCVIIIFNLTVMLTFLCSSDKHPYLFKFIQFENILFDIFLHIIFNSCNTIRIIS